MKKIKSVYEYDNYRVFLRDTYNSLKALDKKFSFRFFSKAAGFKSSSVLKMIIDGKRNLGSESIERFAQAFKLSPDEASFFRILVNMNQAKTATEKQSYAQALLHFNDFKKNQPLVEAQYHFYALWYMPIIWELAGVPGFRNDGDWISKKMGFSVTPSEARKALQELQKLGLLERTPKGFLVKSKMNLRTANEVASSAVAQWHREMMKRAGESIDNVPRELRDISSVTCAMSAKTALKIKERIQVFRKELMEIASEDTKPEAVYQMNFQFFPQTRVNKEDSE